MHEPNVRPRRLRAVLAAFALVVTSLVATASPAAAAVCVIPTDNPTEIAVHLTSGAGSTTTLRLVSGTLFIDGDLCGPATSVTVFDFDPDDTEGKVLVIDATESWGTVFVNLFLELEADASASENGGIYEVRVLTGAGSETVSLTDNGTGSNFAVTNVGGALQLNGQVVNFGDNVGDPIDWVFDLGAGDDTFEIEDERFVSSLTVDGGDGDDTIVGTSLDDVLLGGADDDDIRGMAGDDTISGGAGIDTLNGNAGDDTIRGQAGDDILRGGGDDDTLRGGRGADNVKGNGGADRVFGNGGNDTLRGGAGPDMINGGKGQDDVAGNGGDDTFNTGDRAADTVNGGGGDDTCDPCSNSDTIRRVENR